MKSSQLAMIAVSAALLASPAFAQTSTSSTTMTTGAATPGGTTMSTSPSAPSAATLPDASNMAASNAPSDKNPVLTDNGEIRVSKIIGSSVYNDKDQKIGSVDEILLGKDNRPDKAVLSVGGFLGMGTKLVAVPYDTLKFGDTRKNSDNRVMMPGANKDTLTSMSAYHYSTNG